MTRNRHSLSIIAISVVTLSGYLFVPQAAIPTACESKGSGFDSRMLHYLMYYVFRVSLSKLKLKHLKVEKIVIRVSKCYIRSKRLDESC